MNSELYSKVEYVQNMLVSQATGGHSDNEDYKRIRTELTSEPRLQSYLPQFLNSNRDLSQFWQFIKSKFGTYQERREYLWQSFAPALKFLEMPNGNPADEIVTQTVINFNAEYVNVAWQKSLQRRFDDPEGAITSARSFLESVCKHILDAQAITYEEGVELPKLYKLVAENLNLSPGQHTEPILKQILGGCQTVVEGLGAMRNKLSDSHGRRSTQPKPAPRHAELAVNLAGTMANFLIQTFEDRMK